jgi:hypothetical protein
MHARLLLHDYSCTTTARLLRDYCATAARLLHGSCTAPAARLLQPAVQHRHQVQRDDPQTPQLEGELVLAHARRRAPARAQAPSNQRGQCHRGARTARAASANEARGVQRHQRHRAGDRAARPAVAPDQRNGLAPALRVADLVVQVHGVDAGGHRGGDEQQPARGQRRILQLVLAQRRLHRAQQEAQVAAGIDGIPEPPALAQLQVVVRKGQRLQAQAGDDAAGQAADDPHRRPQRHVQHLRLRLADPVRRERSPRLVLAVLGHGVGLELVGDVEEEQVDPHPADHRVHAPGDLRGRNGRPKRTACGGNHQAAEHVGEHDREDVVGREEPQRFGDVQAARDGHPQGRHLVFGRRHWQASCRRHWQASCRGEKRRRDRRGQRTAETRRIKITRAGSWMLHTYLSSFLVSSLASLPIPVRSTQRAIAPSFVDKRSSN